MKLKAGVRMTGVRPEIVLAMIVVDSIFTRRGVAFVVTSITEGTHSRGSEHYAGLAFDLRTHELGAKVERRLVRDEIALALNGSTEAGVGDFDVILEGEGTPNEHIHVEFDPKAPIG